MTIRHLAPPGADYDTGPERDRLNAVMDARRLPSVRDIQHCLGVWRAWQRRPPWDPVAVPPAG